MNTGSKQIADDEAVLDELLRHARSYQAPVGFAETVMQAVRKEKQEAKPVFCGRPWFSLLCSPAAAASLAACCVVAGLVWNGARERSISIDDSLLVEVSLTNLGDDETIEAVYGFAAKGVDALAQDDLTFLVE